MTPPILRFLSSVLIAGGFFQIFGSPVEASEAPTVARPFLSPIFGDHMVLQRGQPNTFWGWTTPGQSVRVQIGERNAVAKADASGRWQVQISPPPAGTECVVKVDGEEHVELHDVLVGDVWLCGGQSNMQFALPHARNGAAEVAAANHPKIRLYLVAARSAYAPVTVPRGSWSVCTPETIAAHGGFSAVAYFFARRVEQETGIPIGLVEDCLGGTPVETWMSPAAIKATGKFSEPLAVIDELRAKQAPEYGNYIMHWYDEYDVGIRGQPWFDPALDDHAWRTVHVPGAFAELGIAADPAVCWFRKEVVLPDPLPKGHATIHLGVVDKMETTYVNGEWVGASSWVENPRIYPIPEKALKSGKNLVTVRVLKLKSAEAFQSPPATLEIVLGDGTSIPLAGEWKAAVSVNARAPHPLPLGYENYPIMPTVLYEGMIEPIVPLAIKGALWYQGEANANRAFEYRSLLPAMIHDWRAAFGQGDFPFYIVSLPAFEPHHDQPGSDDWAELREAQALTAKNVPNCGLAVTIDTGDAGNIHPIDKEPVGDRLALIALTKVYNHPHVFQGPAYRSLEHEGRAIRLRFDHTDGGLKAKDGKAEEFSVAGADRKWHWAEARIDGDTVIVSSAEVAAPVAVRYAWQANPKATLYNGAGLPAVPFRTDDWPGVTDNRPAW